MIALTATATDTVRTDAINQLGLSKDLIQFKTSFNRSNIRYEVRKKGRDALEEMVDWIKHTCPNKNGIVYCLSRKDCETVATHLTNLGVKAQFYHAELDSTERERRQTAWCRNQFQVIVATIAFGMGINKSNVRFVIHHSMPKSVEGFYQESGRAGRDGLVAYSILYYAYHDKNRLETMIRKKDGPQDPNQLQQNM